MIPMNPIQTEMHPATNQEILAVLLVLIWAVWGLIMIRYSSQKVQNKKEIIFPIRDI
jgi:hypothetical protein